MKLTKDQIINDDELCPHCNSYKIRRHYSHKYYVDLDGKSNELQYHYICTGCNAKFSIKQYTKDKKYYDQNT